MSEHNLERMMGDIDVAMITLGGHNGKRKAQEKETRTYNPFV